MGKAYSIRPNEIYKTWSLNEVISCWIEIEETRYREVYTKGPKTLFVYKTNDNTKIDKQKADELFAFLDDLKK